MCINYTNERLQNLFVDIMLKKEKQWYGSQCLDVPFVQFFDNVDIIGISISSFFYIYFNNFILYFFNIFFTQYILILDVFDNKIKGIFTLLNDECAFRSDKSFGNQLKNAWKKDETSLISWDIRGQKSKENLFLIRHFTNDVIYSTVCILKFVFHIIHL